MFKITKSRSFMSIFETIEAAITDIFVTQNQNL